MFKKLIFLIAFISVIGLAAAQPTHASEQAVNLKNGFNFVSFTVTPPATPLEFLSKSPNIQDVYLYSAAAGSFLSYSDGTLTSLAAGKGYIVKASAAADITISGADLAAVGNITLQPGFNLVGFSKTPPKTATFSQLMGADTKVVGLYKWSPAAGTFVSVIRNTAGTPEQIDGTDPSMKAGDAYFIKVSESSSINYDPGPETPKTLVSISVTPESDMVAVNGVYALSKIKTTALYSDGSTAVVTPSFTAERGTISGANYTAPQFVGTAVITASYTEGSITRNAYFSLSITSSSPVLASVTSFKCSYKLSSSARIIDEETVFTQSYSETNIVISDPTGKLSYQAGDIIMGYKGDGFLREATSVTKLDTGIWMVQTTKTSMERAFEELDYQYKGKLSSLAHTSTAASGSVEERAVAKFLITRMAAAPQPPGRGIISADKLKKIMDNVNITIALTKAEIGFDPILECSIKVSWFKLKRFLFVVGGSLSGTVEFNVSATGSVPLPINAEYNIYSSVPMIFTIGPVPFTFEWDMNCGVDAKAAVSGEYTYSNRFKYIVRMGAEYTDTASWRQIKEFSQESNSEDSFGLKGSLEIKPYFDVGFALKVAGIAGPKMTLELFFSMLAEMTTLDKVDFSAAVGITAKVAFVVELFSFSLAEFSADIYTWKKELYKKTLNLSVSPPLILPASGNFITKQTITMSSTNENAIIKYTTDGTTPSATNGTVYSGPFDITATTNISAVAVKTGAGTSSASSATYTLVSPQNVVKVALTVIPAQAVSLSVLTAPISKDDNFYYFYKDTTIKFTAIKKSGYIIKNSGANLECSEEYEVVDGATVPTGKVTCTLTDDLIWSRSFTRLDTGGTELVYFNRYVAAPAGGTITAISESGQASPDDLWSTGTKLRLTAIPASGYYFDRWRLPDAYTTQYSNPCPQLIEVTDNNNYNFAEAVFVEKKKLGLVVEPSSDDCTSYSVVRYISSEKSVPLAESSYFGKNWEIKFTFVPAAGKRLIKIETDTGGGREVYSTNTMPGTVETSLNSGSDITIYPIFELIPQDSMYTVNTSVYPAGAGTVTVSADQLIYNGKYPMGTNITLTATPSGGYALEDFYWPSGTPGVNLHSSSNPLKFRMHPDDYYYISTTKEWKVTAQFKQQ